MQPLLKMIVSAFGLSLFLVACGGVPPRDSSLDVQGATLYYSASVTTFEALQVKDFMVKKQFFGSNDTSGTGKFLKLQRTDGRLQLRMGFDEITLQNAVSQEITKLEFSVIAKVMGDELKQPISVLVCETTLTNCQEFLSSN